MRYLCGITLAAVLSGLFCTVSGQGTCTGLCLQQVKCPTGQASTISGKVYAPNGTDPLPNVLVYIPNAAVEPFTLGVECAVAGQPPSGSPLVGTTTAVDGSFTITNVPVGNNIPLVIQSGRWRRQLTVPATAACANTDFSTRMPTNQTEGDIPKFAVVTGNADQVECVLLKVGVDPTEFTNPGGTGRINLYLGENMAGAQIDANTPLEGTLMGTTATINQYDVVMLPCQGMAAPKTADELNNFVSFANSGGRVYSSHYSYDYMDGNLSLAPVANWQTGQYSGTGGNATVDTSFAEGETLAQWLQLVGATTTEGQMALSTVRVDMSGVVAPTQSWLTLNGPPDQGAVMQFVYDAPVGGKNQCGRVLFNEYHVENPVNAPKGMAFPNECSTGTAMTPQEKLLEFSLFELTNDGGEPTISPTTADFGSQPVGFTTASQTFTWTNNSTFPASATAATGTADYLVTGNNCTQVAGGSSCQIKVAFKPTALGTRTDTLTVNSSGPSLTASLTGVGIPDLTVGPATTQFGNRDVGDPLTKVVTVTNPNPGPIVFPGVVVTGDYSAASNCGSSVAATSSCTISVVFTPTTTGDRPGTLTLGINVPVMLDGNGVDFTFSDSPSSGSVIAGLSVDTNTLTTPIAGFAAAVTVSCTTSAPATTCTEGANVFTPVSAVTTAVQITTVSEYTVVGYGGFGGRGLLWLVGAGTGLLLYVRRRSLGRLARAGVLVLLVGVVGLSATGCSGKYPAKNALYTPPGTYTVTLSATDGFLVHTASYSLTVSAK
jgi:hypothetical protein